MIENLQREDLNPMEEAEGYQTLMQQYNMTQEETAQRVGKSRSTVANAMRLLKLCPPVRAMVEDGRLSSGHARAILPLSPAMQESAANAIIKDELSVRQTEQLVKKLTAPPKPEQPEPDGLSVDYAKEAAKELGSRLGLPHRYRPEKGPHRTGILRGGGSESAAGRPPRPESQINVSRETQKEVRLCLISNLSGRTQMP